MLHTASKRQTVKGISHTNRDNINYGTQGKSSGYHNPGNPNRDKFSACGVHRLHTLKPKAKYCFEVNIKQKHKKNDDESMYSYHTSNDYDTLCVIDDLYSIVGRFPTFHDRDFTIYTPQYEILNWIFEEIDRYIEKGNWIIQQHYTKANESKFKILNYHEYNVNENKLYTFSFDFIKRLNTENTLFLNDSESLHDLLIDYFAVFIRKTGIETWEYIWNDQNFCEYYDMRISEEPDTQEKENLAVLYDNYETGDARRYSQMLRRQVDYEKLKERIHNYNPNNEFEVRLFDILEDGIMLMESGYTIGDFCYQSPENDDDFPLLPHMYMIILWNCNDDITDSYIQQLNDINNDNNSYPPIIENLIDTKSELKQLEIPDFPDRLKDFLLDLDELIQDYSKSYSKNDSESNNDINENESLT